MFKYYNSLEILGVVLLHSLVFSIAYLLINHALFSIIFLLPLLITMSFSRQDFMIIRKIVWNLTKPEQHKLYYFNLLAHSVLLDQPTIIKPILERFKVNPEELAQALNENISSEALVSAVPLWFKLTNYCFLSYGHFESAGLANLESNYPSMMTDFHKILQNDEIKLALDNYLFDKFVKTGQVSKT